MGVLLVPQCNQRIDSGCVTSWNIGRDGGDGEQEETDACVDARIGGSDAVEKSGERVLVDMSRIDFAWLFRRYARESQEKDLVKIATLTSVFTHVRRGWGAPK